MFDENKCLLIINNKSVVILNKTSLVSQIVSLVIQYCVTYKLCIIGHTFVTPLKDVLPKV